MDLLTVQKTGKSPERFIPFTRRQERVIYDNHKRIKALYVNDSDKHGRIHKEPLFLF